MTEPIKPEKQSFSGIRPPVNNFTMTSNDHNNLTTYLGRHGLIHGSSDLGGGSFVPPPPPNPRPIVTTTNLNIDGRQLATQISEHLADLMEHPTQAPYGDGQASYRGPDNQPSDT